MTAKERLIEMAEREFNANRDCMVDAIVKPDSYAARCQLENWVTNVRESYAALELAKAIPEVSSETKVD